MICLHIELNYQIKCNTQNGTFELWGRRMCLIYCVLCGVIQFCSATTETVWYGMVAMECNVFAVRWVRWQFCDKLWIEWIFMWLPFAEICKCEEKYSIVRLVNDFVCIEPLHAYYIQKYAKNWYPRNLRKSELKQWFGFDAYATKMKHSFVQLKSVLHRTHTLCNMY